MPTVKVILPERSVPSTVIIAPDPAPKFTLTPEGVAELPIKRLKLPVVPIN